MAKASNVLQTQGFKKTVKKLKASQKKDLDAVVRELIDNPNLGEQKKGDLSYLRMHKFKMNKQLTLLGYSFNDGTLTLELMVLSSHENFYRDIKLIT